MQLRRKEGMGSKFDAMNVTSSVQFIKHYYDKQLALGLITTTKEPQCHNSTSTLSLDPYRQKNMVSTTIIIFFSALVFQALQAAPIPTTFPVNLALKTGKTVG
jgi:hypothetical protein